ncbi:8-oxo-dGTP pyrophosphatase MutT, NUDIX family [Aliiroseovarius halocynthiae]|uniref:CoA pyrophosphatase n=1 Tax=Aliiroseovarius halocynthiae TaxID=985055 RepID=A0A545SNX5_9RHOB|nr:CoA pyrophosphatase [Aliiroseovarius halocynthiae]TQV66683.1 CoA pyrophosphatase [Aliiroseovarius halocynthiae]SMR82558.1 8-oxo-dGTP pyrophosphatase MutT, NUDIX family [Aliiroseovarius halocynthiae]
MVTAPKQIAQLRAALSQSGPGSSDFDLTPGVKPLAGRKLRPAGVLMPFIETPKGLDLVLTQRSSALKHHPGQIAFPGGKRDDADADIRATALREAYEEIGLHPNQVELLGQLPEHETVTGFTVTPVLGLIREEFTPTVDPGEVEEAFRVPFKHVSNLAKFSKQGRYWQGQMRWYDTVPLGPYYIWGATARMLRGLAERLEQ